MFAQAPQAINYQAVARDASGNPIKPAPGQTLTATVNIKIKQGQSGLVLYEENHSADVDMFGLFTLKIGNGSPLIGSFSSIPWETGSKWLETIVSVPNNPSVSAGQELVSVPYALYAEETKLQAGNGINVNGNIITNTGDNDNNPNNEFQTLNLTGNTLKIEPNGNSVTLPMPNSQLANITDDMPTSFTTTVRGAAWQTMESKLQAQAPSAGTYLILYTLRATNFTDNDFVFFKVSNAITGGDYASSVLMSANNGLEYVTSSSFCIANLSQGEVVQVREKMEGSGSTTVTFQDGRLTLIKIQ